MSKTAAFLWDESFLWGLMAYKALNAAGLSFDLIRSDDIKDGKLTNYKMLFVPGGWASNKSKALGESGLSAIREFVADGGSYLGFCGGAGLATKAKDCIGLLDIKRRPTKERVPSFSGRIHLNMNEHPIWREGKASLAPTIFHAWWPSQFIVEDDNIKILATYGDALPDAFSSDLNVGDVELTGGWAGQEDLYGINLTPKRLKNEPAVIEGLYGKGKVILSLIHFDTPDDVNGQSVLINLWKYLAGGQNSAQNRKHVSQKAVKSESPEEITCGLSRFHAFELFTMCSDLIFLGERNFLWFWRNPMLLQWRRGVRGLEYNTLYIMMKEIQEAISRQRLAVSKDMDICLTKINKLLIPFTDKAKQLLIHERHAIQKGHITYERCDDPEIQRLRSELFSESKSHGGKFKELIDEVDKLLIALLT